MRWLAPLVVALIVVPVCAQDNEAEKLYRTMEQKIRTAKTVQVTFDVEMPIEGRKLKFKVFLAPDEKLRIEMDSDFFGQQVKLLMISDGKTSYSKINDDAHKSDKANSLFSKDEIGGVISRLGLASGLAGWARRAKDGEKERRFDLDKELPTKEFKLGPRETIGKSAAQVVEYVVTVNGIACKVSVWIDTQSSLPLKRVVVGEDKLLAIHCVETYGTFTIDGRLDPKLFEIPK